jgi:predicted deacylase
MKGTLMVVPIVNTFGFINHSRYLPDRRDLNRSFPGPGGSLAARLAHLFMTEIVARAISASTCIRRRSTAPTIRRCGSRRATRHG